MSNDAKIKLYNEFITFAVLILRRVDVDRSISVASTRGWHCMQ